MNIAIIPARRGSKRIAGKNTKEFHGKEIIRYSIEAALTSDLFDEVYVSSDDPKALGLASIYGAEPLPRAAEMARNEVGTQEVMRWLLSREFSGKPIEYACCIYATAPLMTAVDLRRGYESLLSGADDAKGSDRYDFVFVEGWYYWGKASAFLGQKSLEGPRACQILLPERWIDINIDDDWLRAEKMYAALHGGGA